MSGYDEPDVCSNNLTTLRVGMNEDVLNQVVAILIASDYKVCQCAVIHSKKKCCLLSMRGIRGRSARPSQTRSR